MNKILLISISLITGCGTMKDMYVKNFIQDKSTAFFYRGMTEEEKNEPHILKADRIRRIARGSGVKEKNVRELLAQWNRSRKMMKGIKGNRKLRRQMKGMMGDMDDADMPM